MTEPGQDDWENKVMFSGFDIIIQQIEKYTKKSSIITFSNDDGIVEKWDVVRKGNEVVYGTNSYQNRIFKQYLLDFIMNSRVTSIILRSFTDVKESNTGLPFKELRGYSITHRRNGGKNHIIMEQLSAEEMFSASNTDHRNGKPLEPEKSVIYCEGEHCIDSNHKPVVIVGFSSDKTGNNK